MALNIKPKLQTLQQSHVLAHPLSGTSGLDRETGASHKDAAVFDAWARALGARQLWSPFPGSTARSSGLFAFTALLYDEETRSIIAGMRGFDRGSAMSKIMNLGKIPGLHTYSPYREEICPEAMLTSISASPSRTMLVTTQGTLLQPSSLYPVHMATDSLSWESSFARSLNPYPPTGIYWASAARPLDGLCVFAVAGSNGMIVLREREGEGGWEAKRRVPVESAQEVTAVDWLSPTVVLEGSRTGAVRLWDLRSDASSEEPRIQHPSALNHVRSIDENLLVVAGPNSQLCTYDLRYANRADPRSATRPYDKFPTYRNQMSTHQFVGLDVHRNLVAAASDDMKVQIFDVKKGIELASRIKNLGANASCVRFVDEQRSGNGLKLMVAAGRRIEGWAFEGLGKTNALDRDEEHYMT